MLYYIHIQETIGDFNESIIWLRNVDYEEAVELIQNNSPAFCNNISFSIPYHLEPTIITNDLTLSLLYRNAFDLNELIIYCGLVIDNTEHRPFYYQRTNFNSKYSRFIIQAINQIVIGNYSFASLNTQKILSFLGDCEDEENLDINSLIFNGVWLDKNESEFNFSEDDIYFNNLWEDLPLNWKKLIISPLGEGVFNNYQTTKELTKSIFQTDILDFEKLEIIYNSELDITYIKFFSNLKNLLITRKNIVNSRFIDHLENLETINLSGSTIDDISFLKNLKNLKKIDLSGAIIKNQNIFNDTDFALDKVEYLDICNCFFDSYKFLENFKKLKVLKIAKSNFKDFDLLLNFDELEQLDISFTTFKNFNFIKNSLKLKRLDLYATEITNTEGLNNFNELVYLNIGKTQIKSILPLYANNNLETLICYECKLTTLTPLKNLKKFDIRFNNDIDVDEILNYEKLLGYKILDFQW